jgi:hypothetical protein
LPHTSHRVFPRAHGEKSPEAELRMTLIEVPLKVIAAICQSEQGNLSSTPRCCRANWDRMWSLFKSPTLFFVRAIEGMDRPCTAGGGVVVPAQATSLKVGKRIATPSALAASRKPDSRGHRISFRNTRSIEQCNPTSSHGGDIPRTRHRSAPVAGSV